MNDLKNVVKKCRPGAKYKRMKPEEWKRNESKKKRTSGDSYTSPSTGKLLVSKNFTQIKECCAKKCYDKLDRNCQKELFAAFYSSQSKEAQDQLLANSLERFLTPIKPRLNLDPKKERLHTWKYSLKSKGEPMETCRSFILKLFQISEKRLRVIQAKVVAGECFAEKRGTHGKQRKLQDDVYKLALEHLELIPHRRSHYSAKRSNRLYFENPTLTVKDLFSEFQRFYLLRTEKPLDMKFKTYFKCYRQTNFTTKKPKTDTCDYCCASKMKLLKSPDDRKTKVELELHENKARKHDDLKREYIINAKESDEMLVCEFDYAQNLPLPKLTICKQFYKRLIWLYIFNVHCHNDGSSFIYTFLESTAKKGPNSVASFLFDFFQKKLLDYPNIKKVVFLSDAAGGQNKNGTMLKFCSYVANAFNVEVIQLFPVRGHSFGQCDRNFGLVRSKLRGKEVIETPQLYYEAFRSARAQPTPFELIHDTRGIMFEWEKALAPFFDKNPSSKGAKFGIQQYCQIMYSPNGKLAAAKEYDSTFQAFRYMTTVPTEINLEPSPKVPFKMGKKGEGKVKDVQDLFMYLQDESIKFFQELFDSIDPQKIEQPPFPEGPNEGTSLNTDGDEIVADFLADSDVEEDE